VTIYIWKSKCKMEVSEGQRLRVLDDENRHLKTLVADLNLDKEMLCMLVRGPEDQPVSYSAR
jgi:putative transposase